MQTQKHPFKHTPRKQEFFFFEKISMAAHDKETKTSVLLLPWLAHGHISPFLELAKKLADRNFQAYICSTPVLLESIKNKITEKYAQSIKLVPFHIPSTPELPSHCQTTNGLPPHLMVTLKDEYEKASPQFSTILTEYHPDIVLYDFNQVWAAEMANSQSIPAVQFLTGSASLLAFTWYMINNPEGKFPCPEIYFHGYELRKLGIGIKNVEQMKKEIALYLGAQKRSYNIVLVKTCREIEDKYLDMVSGWLGKKVVPVGQLVEEDYSTGGVDDQNEIIEWLDKKDKRSVIFASFGSEYFLTVEERYGIANGLELSGMNFVWAIRFSPEEKIKTIEEALPEGFLERIKDRGIVVEGWAPQARILKHSSTGAFMSHCGWSSVMESMKFGVPIVALPMQIDQPLNARLVEAVGVGIEAIRDDDGNLQSKEIANTITKVMKEESGEDVRKKVKQLSQDLKIKGDEEIDFLVEEIKEICNNFSKQSSPDN